MNDMEFEDRLRSLASGMEYPHTPDISAKVLKQIRIGTTPRITTRRFARSLTFVVVLLLSLLLIPPARAAIVDFIQIGIVRIFPRSAVPTLETPKTELPDLSPTLTSVPPSDLFPILDQLAGERTLAEAQRMVGYEILLPAYPSSLGLPDRIFVQDAAGAMTILVWLHPSQPERIVMSLHFIPTGSWAIDKGFPQNASEASVNGQRAFWGEGPYPLRLYNGNLEFVRLIEGHVLIWAEPAVTYRLETDLPFAEALKVAESLEPIP